MTPNNKRAQPFGRTIWSILSSGAIHSVWIASTFFALTFLNSTRPLALVDYESVEFSEDSASTEGAEGSETETPDETVEEGEEFVVEDSKPIDEITEKEVLEDIAQENLSSLEDTARRVTESSNELEANKEAEVNQSNQKVWQGTAEALEIARIAKQRMQMQLRAVKGGKTKRAGTKIPTVQERIKSRGEAKYLSGLQAEDILVVAGSYDAVEYVLKFLNIPYRITTKRGLERVVLRPEMVLIFNCDSKPVSRALGKKLAAFTLEGGYIFSSDWELHNTLQIAFPQALSKKTSTSGQRVRISAAPKFKFHPYLRDVFMTGYGITESTALYWQVDGASDFPKFLSKKVIPLVVSKKLEPYGSSGCIAFAYPHGRGAVLHVLSHFTSQADPKGDGFALQQMLANFIIEKQKAKLKEKKR
jgi:hypothetical protein